MPQNVNYPIIIIEGADAGGKTTLANELVKLTGGRYIHLTYRFKNKMHTYQTAAIDLALRLAEKQPVIIDRWWMSNDVYGAEFRGEPDYKLESRLQERVALRYGVTYVLCCPSDEQRQAERHGLRAGEGGEMYSTLGTLPKRYKDLYLKMRGRSDTFLYDMDSWSVETVPQAAQALFESASDYFYAGYYAGYYDEILLDRDYRRASGNFEGKYMFVGDFGIGPFRREVWPYWPGGKHDWLTLALDHSGYREEDCCFISPGTHAVDLIRGFGEDKVIIALSSSALRLVEDASRHCDLVLPSSKTDPDGVSSVLIEQLKNKV